MFACLREVYDGKFVRRLGSDGGKTFAWVGHAGFVGGCTEAIDSPGVDLGLLGERFNYHRVPESTDDDDFIACVVADENAGHQREIRAERSRLVAEFFASLTIPDVLPTITEDEQTRLATLATLGARCRSSVVRDGYGSGDTELVPGSASSTPVSWSSVRHRLKCGGCSPRWPWTASILGGGRSRHRASTRQPALPGTAGSQ